MRKHLVMRRLAPLLVVVILTIGCRNLQQPEEGPPPENVVSDTGTIHYVELEGGFYGLVADEGGRYLPDSLDEAYREDGLRVRFRAEVREDVMTAQMWGTPVTLVEIMRLEE